jgi:hypothetical protein
MRKTIATITLALGIALTGAPAFADGGHPTACYDTHGAEVPCTPTDQHPTAGLCYDPHGYVISCYEPHALGVIVPTPTDTHPTAHPTAHRLSVRLRHHAFAR